MQTTVTLQQLRRGIGRQMQDLIVLEATGDSTDRLSFTDENNLFFPDRSGIGRIIYFTSGGNLGYKRVVTDSSQSLSRVTWSVDVLDIPVTGDSAELWRKRGQGYDPIQDVNQLINDLLREAARYNLAHDIETLGTFDVDSPTFTIPATTRGIYAVEWEDADGLWTQIPRCAVLNGPGWSIERNGTVNTLVIRGGFATDADTYSVRIRRYVETPTLASDSDTTIVSYDWVVLAAKALLLEREVRRQDYASQQLWQRAVEAADMARAGMVDRPMPDTVML